MPKSLLPCCLLLPFLASLPAAAEEAPPPPATLTEALARSKAAVTWRYRWEEVSDDAFAKEAQASTLRTTLAVKTAAFRGFSLFAEAENVAAVFDDERYNNAGAGALSNLVRNRPVIADPELTEINQAYLSWQGKKAEATLGRQEIAWGDERFLGPVGWRQNHQSIDALRLKLKPNARVGLEYAFMSRVHRVFGDDKDMASHWLAVPISFDGGRCQLTAYGLLLDYDAAADSGLSTLTWGAEFKSSRELGHGAKIAWEAELARQEDAGDNPRPTDALYVFATAGYGRKSLFGRAGYEVLEGSSDDGVFQTPLATLHKWNGWADKFLSTPPAGLEDRYLELEGEAGPLQWRFGYHEFKAESSSLDYGSEIDGQLLYKTSWKQTLALKLASYDADRLGRDTDKWFFWTSWQF